MGKYKIISGPDLSEVEKQVNELLEQGWKLAGGISLAYKHEHNGQEHIHGHLEYAQAMEKVDGE